MVDRMIIPPARVRELTAEEFVREALARRDQDIREAAARAVQLTPAELRELGMDD